MSDFELLQNDIVACTACPRLRSHCLAIAIEKRAAFIDETYWGRPVPNFGNAHARLLVVGLAPAAHGANRTGRMFTGDRSGEWLYRALYRAGFASQPVSQHRDDELVLQDCAITAVCHCAPPDNQPTRAEQALCQSFLARTVNAIPARTYVALGQIAWDAMYRLGLEHGWTTGPRPKFSHGACTEWSDERALLGSYHPSQQNTFTGRLTEPMFDAIFDEARRRIAGQSITR